MSLVKLDEGIFVDSTDVVSIEDHEYWSGFSPSGSDYDLVSRGSVITLKNGRKIYLKKLQANDVFEKLNQTPTND